MRVVQEAIIHKIVFTYCIIWAQFKQHMIDTDGNSVFKKKNFY